MTREQATRWLPGPALGLLVLVVAWWEVRTGLTSPVSGLGSALFVLLLAVAVAAYRLAPGLALTLLWVLGLWQLWSGIPLLIAQLGIAVVAYGCARHGSVATVTASAASAPTFALVTLLVAVAGGLLPRVNDVYYDLLGNAPDRWTLAGAVLLAAAVVVVPWLLGLLLRVLRREQRTRAEQAETARERDQAAELAELREGQARLARDVHDVVGHSLAVILAQAESAQYLPDEPERLKQTLATIATSARTSLQDVRHVLGATGDKAPRGGLDTLLDGVRSSGHEVLSSEVGDPRPLPPELEVVAYRVLQEMLTNAIRHGRRDEPVRVERHWQDELRIEVRNVIGGAVGDETVPLMALTPEGAPAPPAGHGLDGMRRRLEAVGGRLDVRPRLGEDPPTFTVTAWLPTRAQ